MKVRGLNYSQCARLVSDAWRAPVEGPRHVFICVADHYEPEWGGASDTIRRERVEWWVREYPRSVAGIADSVGRVPQHSFFYPLEEYRPRLLDQLARLCHRGFGDVEVHLHHDHDTAESLREKLENYKRTLNREHGLLHRDRNGNLKYGFIHGNWALDNSRPDGRWCGVNNELTILRETGCYADFTLPAAPDASQTTTINSIYYAVDDPRQPKSHDTGTPAEVGGTPPHDGLLMIQGPLALDWKQRKAGLFPRVENSSIHARRPPTERRLDLWLQAGVGVVGRPDWSFIKLHTHGGKPANAEVLLGPAMREFHESLARRAREDAQFQYYYVTAREMADLVHAAEAGQTDPRVVLERKPATPTKTLFPFSCQRWVSAAVALL